MSSVAFVLMLIIVKRATGGVELSAFGVSHRPPGNAFLHSNDTYPIVSAVSANIFT